MVVIGIILGLVMVVIGINPYRLSPSRYGTITLLSSRIWTATEGWSTPSRKISGSHDRVSASRLPGRSVVSAHQRVQDTARRGP